MSSSLATRLKRGIAANGMSQAVTALISIAQLPIMIGLWGAEKWGQWLVLSAVPAYLALSDLGFGAAVGTEMAIRVGRDDRPGALKVFQSGWALVTGLSVVACLLMTLFVFFAPWDSWIGLSEFSHSEAIAAALVLIVQVAGQQQLSLIAAAYKSDGLYARVLMLENIQRLAAFGASIGAAIVFRSVFAFALAGAAAYLLVIAFMAWDLKRQRGWVAWGLRYATKAEIKPLVAPALSFMAYPMGHAVSLQGFILVVNALFGPGAVTAWSTLRTLSRVVIQSSSLFSGPLWIELSSALGAGDMDRARKAHSFAVSLSFWTSVAAAVGLLAFGPWIYSFFTHKSLPFDLPVMLLLLVASVVNVSWSTASATQVALNQHVRLTAVFLTVNVMALLAAIPLGLGMGLAGAALALLLAEAAMIALTLPRSLAILDYKLSDFPGILSNPLGKLRSLKTPT